MPHKILYDADCSLCVRFAAAIRGMDRKNQFDLVSLQNYYKPDSNISLEDLENELHVIDENGNIFAGDKAFQFILQKIPAAKPLSTLISKTSSGSLLSAGINRIKRWTKSRYSLKAPCPHCQR
tara:strand:+ start:59 stop:427 length:369 start_codon:yes stop_codon:yes gene_type:complete